MNDNEPRYQYYKAPRWIIAILFVSLLLNAATYSRISDLKQEIRNIEGNINGLTHSISSSVSNNIYQINEALRREASIVTEFKYDFAEYKDKRINLLLNVKPKEYTAGDKLYFSYKIGDESPILIEAQSVDNVNFKSKINISIMDNVDLDLIIDNGVSRKVEKLESIYRPVEKYTTRLSAYPLGGSMAYDKTKSALVITYGFELNDIGSYNDEYKLSDAKISIVVNDKEIATEPMPKIDSSRYNIQLKDYGISCKTGDTIAIYITVKDNKGLNYSVLAEAWKIGDNGIIEQSDKMMQMGIVEIK
jgi:hypothetical protein